jgi:hypothetical protein
MAVTINASTTTGLVQTADTSGVLQLQTNSGTTAVTIDTSQNVGIGTSSPSAKLQVDAANYALSTSYATLTSNLAVRTTTAQAANVGGEIALGGYYDGSNISDFVRLHGKKLNSTSANVSGYFAVEVSNDSAVAPYMFEQMRITNTGLLQFNSGYGSVATAYGCRAWVNFNGTGTVAIRASGNVSSITDNGTGDYTVNFTTAMPDADYAINVNSRQNTTDENYSAHISRGATPTTSGCTVSTFTVLTYARADHQYVNVSIFR